MPKSPFTAVIQRTEDWWIGWIAEVPGVNGQAHTREELFDDLRSALEELFEMNRAEAVAFAAENGTYEEVPFSYEAP